MPVKICVICGDDCSSKPRTKDAHGRYYCTSCYQSALRVRKNSGAKQSPLPADEVAIDLVSPQDEGEKMSRNDSLEGIVALTLCPGCGTSIGSGSVICTNCGYDFRTATTLQVMTGSAPENRIASSITVAGLLRPQFVGVAVLAVYGLLAYVAVNSRSDGAFVMFSVWHGLFMLNAVAFVLIAAFRTSIIQGFLTLFVPFYMFYFALAVEKSAWVRWLFAVGIAGIALSAVVNALTGDVGYWGRIPS